MRKLYALFIFSLVMVMTNSLSAQEKIGKEEFLKKIWNYEEDPNEFILRSDKPVILDFYADWCGPCRMVSPILEEIAKENEGKIVIGKLNVDENPKVAQALGITSIPTMNVYKGGQLVKTIVGAKPKPALLADLAAYL